MNRVIVSINDKFNDYTIVSEPYKKNNIWYVDVKCKCGSIKTKPTGNLKKLTRCKKCNASENYRKYQSGDKAFDLTLLEYLPYDGSHVKIKVKCNCGHIFQTNSNLFGKTKTCRKCYDLQKGPQHPSYKGTQHVSQTYFSQIKLNATKRNIQFNLTIKYLDKLIRHQQFKCYLSGMTINVNDKTASLDRIDSSKGYVKNNVAWCHKHVNQIKSNFPNNYFIDLCNKISKKHFDQSL